MKDFEQEKEVKVEEVSNQEQKKEVKFIGSRILKKNHKVYELNVDTFSVKELKPIKYDAKLNPEDFKDGVKPKTKIRKRYEYNERCIYTTALNIKNAQRKLEKEIIKMGVEGLKNKTQ